jgi:hypothetical protein
MVAGSWKERSPADFCYKQRNESLIRTPGRFYTLKAKRASSIIWPARNVEFKVNLEGLEPKQGFATGHAEQISISYVEAVLMSNIILDPLSRVDI